MRERRPPRRPFVVVNMSMTADGKIATANRAIETFSSVRDHHRLLALRATADGVICGARTVNNPDITLGTGGARYGRLRQRHGLSAGPWRIVVTGRARLGADAGVFRDRSSPLLVLVSRQATGGRVAALTRLGATVRAFGSTRVDLSAALAWLAQQHGVRRLVCEGGAELNDAMFRAGLVDEVRVTLCPKIFGGRAAPTLVEGRGFASLARAARLELIRVERSGGELFLRYRVGHPGAPRPRAAASERTRVENRRGRSG